ncbi:MAG TPA: hypothetical protein VGU01_10325 [Sphingomicrobium sp.]|nr:hypothetical protein [Sphingomicrobium sp.]
MIDMDALIIRAAVDNWAALGSNVVLFDGAAAPSVPASDSAHIVGKCPFASYLPRDCEALPIGN